MPLARGLCHVTDFDQVWSKNLPLVGGLCHVTDFDQVWSKNVPLIGGLCHVMDFNQMWSKNVPLVGGLCHVMDFDQMWSRKMCPSSKDFATSRAFNQVLPNICRSSRQITITFERKALTSGIHSMKGIHHIYEGQHKSEYRAQFNKNDAYHVHHATKNK